MKVKLFCLFCLYIMASKPLRASEDTLALKNSQELLAIFSQLVEKHASLDLIFSKIVYVVTAVPNLPTQLSIRDVTEKTMYWIDFSRIQVGKNVRLKDWKKGRFTLIFSKQVAEKGERRRPKRFELCFLAERRRQTTDFDKLQILLMNILKQLEEKLQR